MAVESIGYAQQIDLNSKTEFNGLKTLSGIACVKGSSQVIRDIEGFCHRISQISVESASGFPSYAEGSDADSLLSELRVALGGYGISRMSISLTPSSEGDPAAYSLEAIAGNRAFFHGSGEFEDVSGNPRNAILAFKERISASDGAGGAGFSWDSYGKAPEEGSEGMTSGFKELFYGSSGQPEFMRHSRFSGKSVTESSDGNLYLIPNAISAYGQDFMKYDYILKRFAGTFDMRKVSIVGNLETEEIRSMGVEIRSRKEDVSEEGHPEIIRDSIPALTFKSEKDSGNPDEKGTYELKQYYDMDSNNLVFEMRFEPHP